MDVAKKVDLGFAYIAMTINIYCKCLLKMFHILQTYVASVLSECCICCNDYIHICCKLMFQMFYLLKTYVARNAFMLQVFHESAQVVPTSEGDPCVRDTDVEKVDLDVAYVAMAIHVCCKYLFRMFHLL
jgi:hypothetical protein